MPSSKNRRKTGKRKGNSRILRNQRLFGRSRLWTWESSASEDGVQDAHAEARTPHGWSLLPPDVAHKLVRHPHHWMICVRALCSSGKGDPWVEEETRVVYGMALNDLTDVYDELKRLVLAEVQVRHVYDLGWICHTFRETGTVDADMDWYLHDLGKLTQVRWDAWQAYHKKQAAQ